MTAAPLDFDACYRASSGRDARFDGQFVMAVRSTGIYCRPSCPARTPKPANVEFHRTSAAAHLAGFRACKRCLPEAVPGSPEWRVREDVAARAMRLISEGVVDRDGVGGLARRLGYSERQLGRVLETELGAGPLALARAQRAQNARHLIVGTGLPFADVAFAAGFASIRKFNDTVREVFGLTPGAMRSRGQGPGDDAVAGLVSVRLAARAPFDGAGVLEFLARRALTGVEDASAGSYARSVQLARGFGVLTVRPDAVGVRVEARLEHLADLPEALARARRLVDLDADPALVDGALAAEPVLAGAIAAAPGVRIPGALEPAELLARAVLGQQVSVAAARTAAQRLVDVAATPLPLALVTGAVTHATPGPAALAEAVRAHVGGPARRREALATALERVAAGDVPLGPGATREALAGALEAVPGIGPWTSGYVALRVLGSPDVMLLGDSAIRAGAARLGLPADGAALGVATERLAPWRSYLMMHLWRAASRPTEGDS